MNFEYFVALLTFFYEHRRSMSTGQYESNNGHGQYESNNGHERICLVVRGHLFHDLNVTLSKS